MDKSSKNDGLDAYLEDLDQYEDEYIVPSAARIVDQKFLAMVVERIIPLLQGPKVIEMGFGDGAWTGKIIERFGRSFIVDASKRLLEKAKTQYRDKVETHLSYFEEFHPSSSFDSVLCSYILEHVVDPPTVLKCCRTWLNPGGLLVVIVPNASSLHRRLGVAMGIQKDVYQLSDSDIAIGHRRVFDAPMLEKDLEVSGFRIETRMPMMFKPLPNSLLTSLNDAQLRGIFDLGDQIPEDQRGILAYFYRVA